MHTPSAIEFADLAVAHDFVPVYRRLLSDTLTPVTAFRLLDDGGSACLFESVIGGERVGRYSFLAANPVAGNLYDYFCSVHVGFGMVGIEFQETPVALGVDMPELQVQVDLSADQRAALAEDLS